MFQGEFQDDTPEKMSPQRGGCYITRLVGVVLVLLAVILTIAVALIVYFAVSRKDHVCRCHPLWGPNNVTLTEEALAQQCKQLAMEGHPEICTPSSTVDDSDGKRNSTRQTTTAKPETEPPTPPTQITNFRLPEDFVPLHYDVEIQPYMHFEDPTHFYFKGKVRILLQCQHATSNVTLHVGHHVEVTASTVKVNGLDLSEQDPFKVDLARDKEREFLIIMLDKSTQVGKSYAVEMDFASPIYKNLKGLYYSSYEEGDKTIYLATTQFAPSDARRAFPCMDEPALKATFNITLVRPKHYTSLANMPVMDSSRTWTEDGIEYVADVYQQTPRMSTYLIAFVICDFDYLSRTTKEGIEVRAWSKPEVNNLTSFQLRVSVESLSFFIDYFQQPYHLSKMDMIAIPDFKFGAMENWGLVTYREIYMYYTPGVTTEHTKERMAFLVCHENAHQWVGNIVTPAWWDSVWVSEGLASFMEYMATDHIFPEWKVFETSFIIDHELMLFADSRVKSHPIHFPVPRPDQSRRLFGRVTYKKGSSLVRMMRHFMGPDTFRRGMINYFKTYAFGAVKKEEFLDVLTEQAQSEGKDINVRAVMDTWIFQMNYPLVTVSRDVHNLDVVHVKQERYLTNRSQPDLGEYQSPYGYRWTIPITLMSSRSALSDQTVLWLWHNETEKDLHVGRDALSDAGDQDGWILANVNDTGFYRVNYQLGNWKALANQLKKNHEVIPVINRAKLISDAWVLFKSGDLPIATALMTLEYLFHETDYLPWFFVRRSVSHLTSMLLFSPSFGPFERFFQNMSKKAYETYGLDKTNLSHADTKTRVLVSDFACTWRNVKCVNDARRLFRQWMDKPDSNPIDRNIRQLVYRTAVKGGAWEEWNFALQMYNESTSEAEKYFLLSALACTEKQWILNSLLYMLLGKDSPVPIQELTNVVLNVARNSHGRSVAWDFFTAHVSKYLSREKNFRSYVIATFADTFNTEDQLEKLKSLLVGKKDIDAGSRRDFENAIRRTQRNVDWRKKNEPVINKWLEDAGYQLDPLSLSDR